MAESVGPPAKKPGVLRRRIIFGIILLAISCGLLYFDWTTRRSYGIGAMVGFSMVFGLRELFRMLEGLGPIIWRPFAYASGFSVVLVDVLRHKQVPHVPPSELVVALYAVILLSFQLRGTPSRERLMSTCVTMFGALYIMVLGSFVMKVRYLDEHVGIANAGNLGYAATLYLILAAKGTDMFAFFTGRFLGKTKLIPKVSPGKTVAGAVGGLLGCVAITCLFSIYSDLGRVFHWTVAVPFGIIIGLSAQAGDLVESLIKRSAAVKDSGVLVPEFGGVLDIIDCILFVAPTIYAGAVLLA